MTNVNEILRDHLTLSVDCMDRIYLNGYIPSLQFPGLLVNFLTKHRGNKIPSPALLGQIGVRFTEAVKDYAQENGFPILHFEPGQPKDEVAADYRQKLTQVEWVVFIGIAQEKAKSFKALRRIRKDRLVLNGRASRCVSITTISTCKMRTLARVSSKCAVTYLTKSKST